MAEYFVESSDMGKLYLNYPMVESFYHMKSVPDADFDLYTSTLEELRNHQYKSRVNRENRDHTYSKFAEEPIECSSVIRQHIDKGWKITGGDGDGLTPEQTDILKAQILMLNDTEKVFVLCTCCYYIAEYNPEWVKTE